MDQRNNIIVLKFGSSVLPSEAALPLAVHEIYRHWRQGAQVIAVVSAFGDTTDQLQRRAEAVCAEPEESALASLLATGEAASSALLGLALNKAGIPARVLDAIQVGLRTVGARLDAVPVAVDNDRLLADSRQAVVVLPGFVGRGEQGDTTLLGRGGSDFTALFLAHKLGARCVLLKDVDGLYTSDPAVRSARSSRFEQVSYDTALRLGGSVVQAKALRFASSHRLFLTVTSIGASTATEVGPFADRLDGSRSSQGALRVALLGCGTVGGGVYQRLAEMPELFQVIGVGTRTGERARACGVPDSLITSNLEALIEKPCDVVIELIGGTKRAASLTALALRLGRDVVSANKALLADSQAEFETLAEETRSLLLYSAAVGGVLPALETIKRMKLTGALQGFSGVLNGTCNFILEQLAAGCSMDRSIRVAQEKGYAEANPELDLNGTDAAQKLILLARAAFGVSLPLHSINRTGIQELDSVALERVRKRGRTVRLVADCRISSKGIEASVKPVELAFDHPFSQAAGAENRLLIEREIGDPFVVSGRGAGRWPTTEAIIADLLDIRYAQRDQPLEACA